MTFSRGEIVLAPFKFTDRDIYRIRPVVVMSRPEFFEPVGQMIGAMITAAARSNWPLDVPIERWRDAQLAFPCSVRMKLFTIDNAEVRARVGRLDEYTLAQVGRNLTLLLT